MSSLHKVSILLFVSLLPSLAFASFDKNLKLGNKGGSVLELQQFLHKDGCLAVEPTGTYLKKTFIAVQCFQKKHALPVTGYFGPLTRHVANTSVTPEEVSTTTSLQEKNQVPQTAAIASDTQASLPTNSCIGKTKGAYCEIGSGTTAVQGFCDNALNGIFLFCIPKR